jgi:hypothetical protein
MAARNSWDRGRNTALRPQYVTVMVRVVYWAGLLGEYGKSLAKNKIVPQLSQYQSVFLIEAAQTLWVRNLAPLSEKVLPSLAEQGYQMDSEMMKNWHDAIPLFSQDNYEVLNALIGWAFLFELKCSLWGNALLRKFIRTVGKNIPEGSLLHWNLAAQDYCHAEPQRVKISKLPNFLKPTRCLFCGEPLKDEFLNAGGDFCKDHVDEQYSKSLAEIYRRAIFGLNTKIEGQDPSYSEGDLRTAVTVEAYLHLLKVIAQPYVPRYQTVTGFEGPEFGPEWLQDQLLDKPCTLNQIPIFQADMVTGKSLRLDHTEGEARPEGVVYLDELKKFLLPALKNEF